jgi:hypothetical protein
VFRVAVGFGAVVAVLLAGPTGAQPLRSRIVNEQIYLAMTVKGCPCKGKLAGTFSASGVVTDRGAVRGTFKSQPTLAKPTLTGTTRLSGAEGTITIAYTGRLIPTSLPHPDGSVDYGMGMGTWTVRAATGRYGQLRPGSGRFYATIARRVVHASYLPA